MTKRERLRAAVAREPVDRVPYAVWCHFPEVDRSSAGLARAVLSFHQRYDPDFLKVTPRSGYAVADWGCVESETPRPDGSRPCARHAVNAAADWKRIRPLDVAAGAYGEHLETLVRVLADPRADAPVLPTIFSPLSLARKLSGSRLDEDLRDRPEAVAGALEAITDTLLRFVGRCLDEGIGGIFYSIQAASRRLYSEEAYARFGEPYDRRILEAATARSTLVVVHCHGEELMFDRLARLPGHAWNWDDRVAGPPLREGRRKVPGAVIGGLRQWATLREATPGAIRAEVEDALAQTGGVGLIVGPGCVLPPDVPEANVAALVKALGGRVRPVL